MADSFERQLGIAIDTSLFDDPSAVRAGIRQMEAVSKDGTVSYFPFFPAEAESGAVQTVSFHFYVFEGGLADLTVAAEFRTEQDGTTVGRGTCRTTLEGWWNCLPASPAAVDRNNAAILELDSTVSTLWINRETFTRCRQNNDAGGGAVYVVSGTEIELSCKIRELPLRGRPEIYRVRTGTLQTGHVAGFCAVTPPNGSGMSL